MKKRKITAKDLARNLNRSSERASKTLTDYLNDPSETNTHDLRTSIRRLEAAYSLLPGNVRKNNRLHMIMKSWRRFFKATTRIRDIDIARTNLQNRFQNEAFRGLLSEMRTKRKNYVTKTRKIGTSHNSNSTLPGINYRKLREARIVKRFDKLARRLGRRIDQNLHLVLVAESRIDELHILRKDCKSMRYLLEICQDEKADSVSLNQLSKMQDQLGTIRDYDVTIQLLKERLESPGIPQAIQAVATARTRKYREFVKTWKAAPRMKL